MGRWAQRRRARGGGNSTATALIEIVTAEKQLGVDDVDVSYSQNVTAASFSASDFTSLPSSETGTSIVQSDANTITVSFGASITTDDEIQYDGATAGVLSPQTVGYT